jgi:hypothetical protein
MEEVGEFAGKFQVLWPASDKHNLDESIDTLRALTAIEQAAMLSAVVSTTTSERTLTPSYTSAVLTNEVNDIQVVLLCIAGALSELSGHFYDPIAGAIEKATADIKRGVR